MYVTFLKMARCYLHLLNILKISALVFMFHLNIFLTNIKIKCIIEIRFN